MARPVERNAYRHFVETRLDSTRRLDSTPRLEDWGAVWSGGKACRPHTLHAVKLAREHKNSRRWSRSHHVFQKMKMGNGRIRPRSGRISGAPKASEPIVGLGFRVRVSVRASHGQNTSCVGIFAYLLKKSSFGVADFSSPPNRLPFFC